MIYRGFVGAAWLDFNLLFWFRFSEKMLFVSESQFLLISLSSYLPMKNNCKYGRKCIGERGIGTAELN